MRKKSLKDKRVITIRSAVIIVGAVKWIHRHSFVLVLKRVIERIYMTK
jgi:hypothetical protein